MKQGPVSVSSEPESGPRVLRCCGTLVASLVVRTPGLIMMPGPGTGETESGSGHAGTKAVFVGLLPSSCGSSASLWCRTLFFGKHIYRLRTPSGLTANHPD
jgi:hypothetical protein